MMEAPIPKDERERLETLRAMKLLDTPPQERFDRITKIATRLFDMPISTLTLIDEDREWFLSVCGLPEKEGSRARSFCGHALLAEDVLVVPDTLKDPRFRDNGMVVKAPHIRFYAGRPLYAVNGKRIGVLCVKDTKPRQFGVEEVRMLKDLSMWAELEINSRDLWKSFGSLETFKREEARRRELETVIDSAPIGIMIAGRDGRIESCNMAMARIFGIEGPRDAIGADIALFLSERNDWLSKLVNKCLTEGSPFRTEVDEVTTNSRKGWFDFRGVPVIDPATKALERFLLIGSEHGKKSG